MVKKLLIVQALGILLIWGIATWQWWEVKQQPYRVEARHDQPIPDLGSEPEEEAELRRNSDSAEEHLTVTRKVGHLPALRFPVKGHDENSIISLFGDKRGSARLHEGVDIKADRHTPVVAVVDGFVEKVREGGSGGKQLYLRSGDGRLYYYAHLEDWSVDEYESVREGQEIGTVGDSGNARGTTPHLHFEVQLGKGKESIDPLPLLTHRP